jgi:hypothetical protein
MKGRISRETDYGVIWEIPRETKFKIPWCKILSKSIDKITFEVKLKPMRFPNTKIFVLK